MSKEQLEFILGKLSEAEEAVQAIPGNTANGQLIDAVNHIKNCAEHLKRYFQLMGAGE